MTKFWLGKKVLVTGSEGMIGKELVIQLKEIGAITFESDVEGLRETNNKRNHPADLTFKYSCWWVLDHSKPDYIFHLAGIKGNPKMTKERPVDFMGPMLQFDTNMILAAQKAGVKRFLYTSSIAVENPESDKYPAWAKQTAETLIEAMRIQYPKGTKYCVVRPANVYGRFDNFDREDNMVVTSLIKKGMKEGKLVMDKKGSKQIRDFINAKDVARNMILTMENMSNEVYYSGPTNLCSGKEESIDKVAKIIASELNIPIEYKDLNLTLGPDKKTMEQN